ncbi:MAG: metallophosphoesterase [Opitutaceae bacterium]|nr:metallophosphoesterase [Opitutaceae bacterium]
MNRRDFLIQSGVAAALTGLGPMVQSARAQAAGAPRTFRLWATSDPHVGTDLRHGRQSIRAAIDHSERGGKEGGPPFDWDIALMLGDFSGSQGTPDDEEGAEIVRQFGALKKHRREDVYEVVGNHDANGPGEPTQWWFRKWIDPTGENTKFSGVDARRRPYPIDGTWERYSFRVGNLLFLMMGDRNDGGPPVGRGKRGGYPSGAVTGETFAWWKRNVETKGDAIVISTHHHMLKETTVASGPWEGYVKGKKGEWVSHYHGYFPDGGPEGASYLYWLDQSPDAQAFEKYLAARPGAIDFWIGGHTHTNPDDRTGGRSHLEKKWNVNFLNCSALSQHHAHKTTIALSRLLTFTEGSDEVRVQCYLHGSNFAPQGWYPPAERRMKIGGPFRFTATRAAAPG